MFTINKKIILRRIFLNLIIIAIFSCSKTPEYTLIEVKEGYKVANNRNIPSDPNYNIIVNEIGVIKKIWFRETNGGPANFLKVSDKGDIFAYNYKTNRIIKYSDKGDSLLSFGGLGYGPGELKNVSNIYIEKDTLKAYMIDQKKYNLYSLSGKFISSKPFYDLNETRPVWLNEDQFKIYEFSYIPLSENRYLRFLNGWNKTHWGEEFSLIENKKKTILKDGLKKLSMDKFAMEYLKYSINKDFISYAENSKDYFKINIFDREGRKKLVINRYYKKERYPLAVIKAAQAINPNIKGSSFKYMQAIFDLNLDKYNRYWVRTLKDRSSPRFYNNYEIYDDKGKYLNKIDFGEQLNFSTIYFIFFEKDKMFVYGKITEEEDSELHIYNY
ncbi:MAG: hypothetical protein CR982_10060 [Candidatus Cloacimonadota bacterium]|nr:MAG: hypothetical protein CR982_10060 [Candidatus Cloacimonadota bacterium]PIE79036.1 MAG: hypothetical protein CSA15_04650 [Candidatus Delongbacteria bacterium]